jgi:subfamily B ATP-binding cassette protein MsbA
MVKHTDNKIAPQQGKKTRANDQATWPMMKRLLGSYLPPYINLLIVATLFMALAAAMTAAVAQLMQPVLDDVLYGQKEHMIVPVASMLFGAFAIRGLSTYAHTLMMTKVSQSIISDIQNNLFGHFMSLDLKFFHDNPSGQLLSRVVNDMGVLRSAISDTLTALGRSLLTLIFLMAVMFYQDWKFTLMSLVVFPIAAIFVIYLGRRLRKVSRHIQRQTGILSARLSQIFQGVRQVKAYNMEQHEHARAYKAIESIKKLSIKSVQIGNLSTPVNEMLVGGVVFSVIIYGGYEILEGNMTPGQLVAFITAFSLAYEPMKKLARLNNSLQVGLGAAERVFEMLDTKAKIKSKARAQALNTKKPKIQFKNVSFSYDKNQPALDGITFTAKPGTVTALVGPSGGGKSTIMNMIPRFYDINDGQIIIGTQNVKDLKLESLRSKIALVSQDVTIFDDTVASNIAYGLMGLSDAGISQEEIEAAAKDAAAHEFIINMPEGYQTMLGENGTKLSGGQKQRISIARAILRDAPILLLDEATSALDNESEQLVQEAFQRLEKGRTTLVIAHRLSTVKDADQILVMNQGQIIEQGTHDGLVKQKGLYAQMYKTGLKSS